MHIALSEDQTLLQDTLVDLKKSGRAILFSTHRMDQAEKLCDEICLIHGGQAVLTGRMREVKSRYERNRVVIDFEGRGLDDRGYVLEDLSINLAFPSHTSTAQICDSWRSDHLLPRDS